MADSPNHLTVQEIFSAIELFTAPDKARLLYAAKAFSIGLRISPEDLLHEAFFRSIAGERKCPRDVKPLRFFINVMKSISSAEREKAPITDIAAEPPDSGAFTSLDESADAKLLREEDAAEKIKLLETMFQGDDDALLVLMALMDGLPPAEIQSTLDLGQTSYATTRRRIRRTLNRYMNGA